MSHSTTHASASLLSRAPLGPVIALLGRALYGLVFVAALPTNFTVSGILACAGGLMVMIGYRTKIGAALLLAHLVPSTLVMIHQPTLMTNVALIGAALLLLHFGAGPLGIDAKR